MYLAREPKHDRDVAIKVLDPEVATASGAKRFVREIRVTARIHHPNILPLLDSGEVDGLPFYVMPYVEGLSLRDRLAREKQLVLADVLQLASEIADALQAAHGHGVVHRDIKPANILLDRGHAVVADFGIVRALSRLSDVGLTTKGVGLGTPTYMSPEQAEGTNVDGRADVYALACVVYEALVGEPPFTGRTAQVILAKKLSTVPMPPSKCRSGLPRAIDDVIGRGLAASPADRFATPREFVDALERAASEDTRTGSTGLAGRVGLGLGVAALGVLGWLLIERVGPPAEPPAEPSVWALFPFEHQEDVPDLNEVLQLRDAISRWSGITVVDPAPATGTRDAFGVSEAADLAQQVGAGRFVWGSISRIGDSLRVSGSLYSSTGDRRPLHEHVVRLPTDATQLGSVALELADELLFLGQLEDPGSEREPRGTRSVPARRAFLRGRSAVQAWTLEQADSAFSEAASLDPGFGAAHLWTALTRLWNGRPMNEWTVPVRQAQLGRADLSARERLMAGALSAWVDDDLGAACPSWELLATDDSDDYVAWYSLARCLSLDGTIVEDPGSPSGWSFRTSYHRAVEAYRTAFRLHPPILRSFRSDSYERILSVLKANGNERRYGFTRGGDPEPFRADPAWQGDSLAFVPWPAESTRSELTADGPEFQLALRRSRETFRDIAATWATEDPESADARLALSLALTMLGDPSGLDTLRHTRSLTRGPVQRQTVMAHEVWLQLALAAPTDEEGLMRARALADSLLEGEGLTDADPRLMAGLAALTGRGHRAARLAARPSAAADISPPPLRRWVPGLVMYSALGGPVDSIAALERRLWSTVRNELTPDQRLEAEQRWLARAATLAFPTYRFERLDSLAGKGDWLLDAQADFLDGDTTGVRDALSSIALQRSAVPPASLTWDSLFPEAWLLRAVGGPEEAIAWIEPSLATLPQASPQVLSAPEHGAALVRAMALRARLATEVGDSAMAARWARAVLVLWSDADPFLQPTVSELRAIAGAGDGSR